jgi:hypothetical protein
VTLGGRSVPYLVPRTGRSGAGDRICTISPPVAQQTFAHMAMRVCVDAMQAGSGLGRTALATGHRWANDYGATQVPKSNSLTLPFSNVMCCVTLTLSTRPDPFATTCSWPVKVVWKVPCCALSVDPNHSVPRML